MTDLAKKRYDRDCWRIVRDEAVVGLINRHADDMWSVSDTQDHRVIKRRFLSPTAAMKYIKENGVAL